MGKGGGGLINISQLGEGTGGGVPPPVTARGLGRSPSRFFAFAFI